MIYLTEILRIEGFFVWSVYFISAKAYDFFFSWLFSLHFFKFWFLTMVIVRLYFLLLTLCVCVCVCVCACDFLVLCSIITVSEYIILHLKWQDDYSNLNSSLSMQVPGIWCETFIISSNMLQQYSNEFFLLTHGSK